VAGTNLVPSEWTAKLYRSASLSYSPLASQAVLLMVKINASHEEAAELVASKESFRQVVELSGERQTGNRVVKEEAWERLLSPEAGKLSREVGRCRTA